MWKLICDIFENQTLLSNLVVSRRFYTAKMDENDKFLVFSANIRHMFATLKSINVPNDDKEIDMAFLNGLPYRLLVLLALSIL